MSSSSRELVTLQGVVVRQDEEAPYCVRFRADMDSDADGTNGQTSDSEGNPLFAYAPGDKGLDYLRNAGYPNGSYRDILVCKGDRPIVWRGGYLSKTAYFDNSKVWNDPDRYLDSASIPFIVVEGFIRRRAKGIVLGCRAVITWRGKSVEAMVGDIGPLYKIGEGSMKLLELLGANPNPKRGGIATFDVDYAIYPGQPAIINGKSTDLIVA